MTISNGRNGLTLKNLRRYYLYKEDPFSYGYYETWIGSFAIITASSAHQKGQTWLFTCLAQPHLPVVNCHQWGGMLCNWWASLAHPHLPVVNRYQWGMCNWWASWPILIRQWLTAIGGGMSCNWWASLAHPHLPVVNRYQWGDVV